MSKAELINQCRACLLTLKSDAERIEFIDQITEVFCRYCGSKYLPCYCTREE